MHDPEIKLEQRFLWRLFKAGFAISAFALGTVAATADEIKIGVVDTERILAESAPAVRALKKIEKEFLPRDQELRKMAS